MRAGGTVPGMTQPELHTEPEAPAEPAKRRRWPLLAAAAAVVVAAGFALTAVLDDGFTVTGEMHISRNVGNLNARCFGKNGYDDIHEGAQVVVTDSTGATVAVGKLGRGEYTGGTCTLPFTIDGVPEGSDFYGIEVAHRGELTYSRDDLNEPLRLTLG